MFPSKKLLALALALVMCLLVSSAAFAQETDPYGKYAEPITLTFLTTDAKTGTTNYDSTDPTRKSATENVWIDAYADFLNIKVERTIAEDATALNALINTGMASGDLPDVIICDKAMFYTLVENGVLQDLTAAYEGYAQKRLLKEAVDSLNMLDAGTVDGELLGFPCVNNFYNGTQLLWVRQDWLNKVGKEAPKTLDEMMDVARAFKDAKLGGEDTIGLGMLNNSSSQDYSFVMAAYGAVLGTWMEKEDGTYEWGATSEKMRGGLLKMQEIYKEGLIKPDFAVSDSKVLSEDVANGRIGMYTATGWHSVTDLKTNMNNDPEAEWICVAIPTVDGERVPQWTNANCGSFTCVTSGCKNPEAIFKMMELEQHMYCEPTDEEIPKYYTADDGFLYWDLRIFRNFGRGDFDFYRSALINEALANKTPADEVAPVIKDFYKQCLSALEGDRNLLGRYICQTMAYPLQNTLLQAGLLRPAYNGPLTENMTIYEKTLQDELTNCIVKVIMGEDISVWEKGVKDWYQNGGQAITDDVNAYYASLK